MDHGFLVRQIATGDKTAFQALYKDLEKPVFRFILSRLNDSFEAADILHDVFMEIWRSAGSFEGKAQVKTWVMGIAWRKTVDAHRRRGRISPTDDLPEEVDDSIDTEACIAAGQRAEHVRFCLEQLKPDHRTAVALAFYEDMTYGEIAAVQSVPEGTIKTRIFHAKKLLLRCLAGRLGEDPL